MKTRLKWELIAVMALFPFPFGFIAWAITGRTWTETMLKCGQSGEVSLWKDRGRH